MKIICWGMLIWVMLGFVGSADAQDVPPPYPDDDVIIVYYEDTKPDQLDILLFINNVCLERVLMLNPTLDIDNVPYGTKIYLPKDEPCYLYGNSSTYASYGRNGWSNPPRLKYYENGQWLDEPYYSADVIYSNNHYFINYPLTPQIIADYFGVCLQDLLAENYLLQRFDEYRRYARMSMDVFLPPYFSRCNSPVESDSKPFAPNKVTIIELQASLLSPTYFSKSAYNTCVEAIATRQLIDVFYNSYNRQRNTVIVEIPYHLLPCYNEQGQRLKYYDDEGIRLDVPFYSDLPVYIAQAGMTMIDVANVTHTCVEQLMKINGYPAMPLLVEIELFLPPQQPCNQEIQVVEVNTSSLQDISVITNTCQDTLVALNPHLNPRDSTERIFNQNTGWILIMPDPCYGIYTAQQGESVYDIEKTLNVCFEEFYFTRPGRSINATLSFQRVITYQFTVTILFSLDAQPCYNESGQRLYYENQYQTGRKCSYPACYNWSNADVNPTYSSMQVYIIQKPDTLFSISKQFNVCVGELIEKNNILATSIPLPEKHPIFIPNTPPCYSEMGKSLAYYDSDGNFLSVPHRSEYLIYYGAWTPLLAYYYNVCINRINDANANKYDERGNANYLGYIIPTDRPPCYDENGNQLNYVCYNQPVDFDTDYSYANPPLSADYNGTYCYNLADSKTVVWKQNMRVHTAIAGDTVMGIAQKYDVPYPLISVVNGLDVNHTIRIGQELKIPSSAKTTDLWWLIPLWLFWGWWCVHVGRMVITEIREKRGWK